MNTNARGRQGGWNLYNFPDLMGGGEEQMHFWAHSPLVPYMLDLVIVPG